ncbi:MAG: prolipoprotein diacylglyceryl transferase [Kiritimatiellaeota bacterium]|nr:prolipoprotein diacylglyceryl transferase [Kiritimatiellota bacterium]
MHPIAFEIFGRPIYWFGVMMALGFLAAISIWNWLAPRSGRPAGYGSELGFWIMVSGVVGARIAEVVTNWPHYASQPMEIIRVDRGGLVYYGGFILACLAVIVFARRHRDRPVQGDSSLMRNARSPMTGSRPAARPRHRPHRLLHQRLLLRPAHRPPVGRLFPRRPRKSRRAGASDAAL